MFPKYVISQDKNSELILFYKLKEVWVEIFQDVKLSDLFWSVYISPWCRRDHNSQDAPIGTKKRFTESQLAAQPHVGLIQEKL